MIDIYPQSGYEPEYGDDFDPHSYRGDIIRALYQMTGTARWQATYDEYGETRDIYYSDEFRRLIGYESEEEFPNTKEALIEAILPEDRIKAERYIVQVERTNEPDKIFEVEYRMINKSGEVRWMHVACKKFYNHNNIPCEVIGTIRDINNDKVVERQGHLVDLLSRDYSSVWYISARSHKMTLVRQNGYDSTTDSAISDSLHFDSYEKMFEEYIDRYVNDADKARVRREVSFGNLLTKVRENELYPINYLRDNLDGSTSYYQICFARFTSGNDKLYFTCGFRDVDSLMRAELEQATEANKAKSNFLFNMSHDIRTPMNAIIGFTKLAIQKKHDPALLAKYLDNIYSSSENLLEILNGVLEMAKIENDKIDITTQLTDTEQFFECIINMFREATDKKGQTLAYVSKIKHQYLYMDKAHIEKIAMNLISNAIKYTPEGGHISVTITEEMGMMSDDCYINMFVADDGVGMSSEFLEHVYDLFSRERTSDTVNVAGTGLGLAITKRIVGLMDGSINIDSKLGKGTRISVTLPLKIGEAPIDDATDAHDMDALRSKCILLAEDNDLNAEIACELLEDEGFTVERAEDGIRCLEMLRDSSSGYYDIVFMDIQMPRMDGYQAAREIRAHGGDKASIPIIAVTANAFEEDMHNAILSGMNSHIAKPFDLGNVFYTMGNVLEHANYYIDNEQVSRFKDEYIKLGCSMGYVVINAVDDTLVYADVAAIELVGCSGLDDLKQYTKGDYHTVIEPEGGSRISDDAALHFDNPDNICMRVDFTIIRRDGTNRSIAGLVNKVYNGEQFVYYVFVGDTTDVYE